ncbi:hypothetical protein VTO73DRAFT_6788 [Trametes versicolor]
MWNYSSRMQIATRQFNRLWRARRNISVGDTNYSEATDFANTTIEQQSTLVYPTNPKVNPSRGPERPADH